MAAEKAKEDKDELEALDTLEKEASEFNKVRSSSALQITPRTNLANRMPKSIAYLKPLN